MTADALIEELGNNLLEDFMDTYMPEPGRFTERQLKSTSVPYFAEWNSTKAAALQEISRVIATEYVIAQVAEQQQQVAAALQSMGAKVERGFFETILDNVTQMAEQQYKNEIEKLKQTTFGIFAATLGIPIV